MDRRPVWFEGMTLDPHHFQQWDRHQQYVLERRIRACTSYGWGVTDLVVDHERLRHGEFVLTACRGILPDGLLIDMPDTDPLPPPQSVRDALSPEKEVLPAFLAVPRRRRRGSNIAMHADGFSPNARYISECIEVADDNTGSDKRSIEVARPNAHVRLGKADDERYISMQIAEIQRASGGTYECTPTFIPPCLRVSASERLQALLRSLMDTLIEKSAAFKERRDNILSQRGLSPVDATTLGLLAAIKTGLPALQHHYLTQEGHPEQVYLTLCQLAGHVAAFMPTGSHPHDVPAYNHSSLAATFNPLADLLDALLRNASPRMHYRRVDLHPTGDNVVVAALSSADIESEQLLLVVKSETMAEDKLVNELPGMLRIASPDTINTVLNSYTRALDIDHTTRLPPGIPLDRRATYFRLHKRGPFWEAVEASGHLAVFAPPRTGVFDMHLLTVLGAS